MRYLYNVNMLLRYVDMLLRYGEYEERLPPVFTDWETYRRTSLAVL